MTTTNPLTNCFQIQQNWRGLILPDPTNNATFESYIIETKIREDVCQEIQPKNAKIARTQGFPKAQKSFERVLIFRPVINTVGSTHGNLDKYIKKLLSPLT